MNLLVTGGAGFIGSNLVHYLLGPAARDANIEIGRVVTLDKLTYAGNRSSLADLDAHPRHFFVQGDIGDSMLIAKLLRDHAIDGVMHLAAESHVDRSIDNPEEFIMTNFVGTYRLLEEFRQYALETGRMNDPRLRFLHVSTDEVYGSLGPSDPAFCETTPYAPNSPYSASKAGSDHLARAYHHTYGLPVVTTNCSNNYGPYQFPEKLLPLMIRKTLKGEPLPVYGDGTNIRDWLYVGDHCRGLILALARGVPGQTYVIGGKCEMRNIDVVRAIIESARELAPDRVTRSADDLVTFVKDRPGHDRRYATDPTRIERELGWSPREDFASGLRRTIRWYLDHEEWVSAIENGSYRGERLGNLE
ncbi:MAG: dTDP-glucose 4,6-dehydratase [Luteolibacter sp.]